MKARLSSILKVTGIFAMAMYTAALAAFLTNRLGREAEANRLGLDGIEQGGYKVALAPEWAMRNIERLFEEFHLEFRETCMYTMYF
jgi:hypothetical protein